MLLYWPVSSWAGGVVSGTEASLRSALSSGGLVRFTNDVTITLSAQITVSGPAAIIDASGHKVTISGGGGVPLFDAATDLTLRGLSLINGKAQQYGGALKVRPGVTVVANRCIFAGNSVTATNGMAGVMGGTNSVGTGGNGTAGTDGVSAFGGAIYNQGSLALVNCILTNNSATAGAGGAGGSGGNGNGTFAVGGNGGDGGSGGLADGGAVYNLQNLTLINCTFSANSAAGGNGGNGGAGGTGTYVGLPGHGGVGGPAHGAAVYNAKNLSMSGSTFSSNSARGGASANAGNQANGTGRNGSAGAEASGGAVFNGWWMALTNCTFYTNTVFGGAGGNGGAGGGTFGVPGDGGNGGNATGGAIANDNTVTAVNCTFSSSAAFGGTNGVAGTGNFPGSDGQVGAVQGANVASTTELFTLVNSILSTSSSEANAFGQFTDGGYNLSSDDSITLAGTSRQSATPKLGTLSANGGPTMTIPLLSGSPAIDRIPPDIAPATDQRGFSRPVNHLSDIGAFEFGAVVTVSNLTLSLTRATNGVIQLSGGGTEGLAYVVQASTNLVNWQTIATNTAPIQFSETATNRPVRFYRITR